MVFYIPYLLLILIVLGNIIYVFHKNNNFLFFFSLLALCWVFSWATIGGPDYQAYLYHYNNISAPSIGYFASFDVGYNFFVFIFKKYTQAPFNVFLVLYYLIGFSLIGKAIWSYSNHPNLILLVYFFTLLPVDIVQVRNFLASALLLYSFRYLIDKKYLKYLLIVFIACSFHKTFIIYLILPIFMKENSDTRIIEFWTIFFLYILLALILHFLKPEILSIVRTLTQIIFGTNKPGYFSTESRYGHLVYWVYQLFILILFFWFKPETNISQDMHIEKYFTLYNSNLGLVVLFPLFMFNNNFLRFYRNIYIMSLIVLVDCTYSYKKKDKLSFLLVLGLVAFSWYGFSAASNTVMPLFRNSIIF